MYGVKSDSRVCEFEVLPAIIIFFSYTYVNNSSAEARRAREERKYLDKNLIHVIMENMKKSRNH